MALDRFACQLDAFSKPGYFMAAFLFGFHGSIFLAQRDYGIPDQWLFRLNRPALRNSLQSADQAAASPAGTGAAAGRARFSKSSKGATTMAIAASIRKLSM